MSKRACVSLSEWQALEADRREAALRPIGKGGQFNAPTQEREARIGWAPWTWNPVTGCLGPGEDGKPCTYCYARKRAEGRLASNYPHGFEPTIFPGLLLAPANTKPLAVAEHPMPCSVFVCSMGDLFGPWVPDEWVRAVLAVERDAPQWTFLHLTKHPARLATFLFPPNAWAGTTMTGDDSTPDLLARADALGEANAAVRFVSLEPLLGPVPAEEIIRRGRVNWIIIGPQSEPNKQPEEAWVRQLELAAERKGIPVFHKPGLRCRENNRRTEWPKPLPSAAIPEEMRDADRWLCWRREERDGKPTKVPYRARVTGLRLASSTDPKSWTSYIIAKRAVAANPKLEGLGFALGDGWVGIDLDHAIDPTAGELAAWAAEIVADLDSYTELSPSGTGIHIIARGTVTDDRAKKVPMPDGGELECYAHGRYFTVTGKQWGVCSVVEERTEQLAELVAHYMVKPKAEPKRSPVRQQQEVGEADLLDVARRAKDGADFAALYDRGDLSAHENDHSRADLALCSKLAFYFGGDPSRMDSAFRGSALMRPKWDEQHGAKTYGAMTVDKAREGQTEFYTPRRNGKPQAKPAAEPNNGLALAPTPPERHQARSDARLLAGVGIGDRLQPASDYTLARYTEALAEGRLFKTPGRGWLEWTGTHWKADTDAGMRLASRLCEALLLAAADARGDEGKRGAFSKAAVAAQKRHALRDALDFLGSWVSRDDALLDSHPYKLNCANGTVDLATGVMTPHDPNDLLTLVTEVEYHPDAKAPMWQAFLERILPDPDVREFVQRLAGWSATGVTTDRVFPILFGCGANGKSTFLGVLQGVLGPYATSATSDMFMVANADEERLATALIGRRLVVTMETREGRKLNEAFVKRVTGGMDALRARMLYHEGFTFRPTAHVWLACNHKPQIDDTTESIWDRLRLLPFSVRIPPEERDPELGDRIISEEAQGVLAWIVAGALSWKTKRLTAPDVVMKATAAYRASEDMVGEWIGAMCIEGPAIQQRGSELYQSYATWCQNEGNRPVGKREFAAALEERGLDRVKRGGNIYWLGLRAKEGPEQA